MCGIFFNEDLLMSLYLHQQDLRSLVLTFKDAKFNLMLVTRPL